MKGGEWWWWRWCGWGVVVVLVHRLHNLHCHHTRVYYARGPTRVLSVCTSRRARACLWYPFHPFAAVVRPRVYPVGVGALRTPSCWSPRLEVIAVVWDGLCGRWRCMGWGVVGL